jgi:TetR/AcrR family transcriptional regulator
MTQDERKKQIVDVTLGLIGKYGIQGATTARIAAAAGVAEPTLYRHFGSRKGILLAVLKIVHAQAAEITQSSQNPDVLQRIREIGEAHRANILSHKRGFADPFFEFVTAPASLGLRAELREVNQSLLVEVVAIVEEGMSRGFIRPDVDPVETAWRITGFFWFEDVAHLLGVQEAVLGGPSTKSLESIIEEIAFQTEE